MSIDLPHENCIPKPIEERRRMTGIGAGLKKKAIISLISFAVSCILYYSGMLANFEFKAYDLFSRNLNPSVSHGDIVIVKIDQQSIDALSRDSINWPWPRQLYAPVFEYLSQADAVFFDMLTTEPSSYGEEDDTTLARSIRKADNVYLPIFLTDNQRETDQSGRDFIKKIALPPDSPPPRLTSTYAVLPIDLLRDACRGSGNVAMKPDQDGVYRRVPLNFGLQGTNIPHFLLGYLMKKGKVTADRNGFSVDGKRLPLHSDSLLLRFCRPDQAIGNDFKTISIIDLIGSYRDSLEGRKPAYDKSWFKGKTVLIGPTAAGLYDLKPTAVSPVSTGVTVHATALDNLLHRNWMTPLPGIYAVVFMFLICLWVTVLILTSHSLARNLSLIGGTIALTLGLPAILFKNALYLQIMPPVISLAISSILAAVYSYATEGKERRFVRRVFSQYMDETIVQYVLKNPDLIRPGGRRMRVTVFFIDIAGFTPIAEKLPAEDIAKMLHTLLNAFSEVVIRNHGVIDKYIGDCIMAFWGAPLQTEHDESNACRAALECIETLAEINRGFRQEGLTEIAIRIGIHSGDGIVGNLGSERLFDYTVVGDTVNLASRLESANKQFRTRILVSASTFNRTGDLFLAREMGMIEVKGKSVPVKAHELVALSPVQDDLLREIVTIHGDAMSLYYEKRWQDAVRLFERILELDQTDGPAAFYRNRCLALMENRTLTEDWQVIRMTEK
jgi:adenylate cyclase